MAFLRTILGRTTTTSKLLNPLNQQQANQFSIGQQLFVWGQRKKNQVDKNFKIYKPVTPAIRHLRLPRNDHLHKGRCYLPLTLPKKKTGGRNNSGRITTRHIGGGHKQRLRMVDFHRNLSGPQLVVRIEYDPGRSAHIALIKHVQSGALSYILAPLNLRPGQIVQSFKTGIPKDLLNSSNSILDQPTPEANPAGQPSTVASQGVGELISAKEVSNSTLTLGLLRTLTIKPGNYLPIRLIPAGTTIHAISLKPDGKASLVRSAGTFAKVVSLGHHHRKTKASSKQASSVQQQQQQQQQQQSTGAQEQKTDQRDLHDLQDHQGDYAQIKLQSGEIRFVHMDACAAIGSVSNPHWQGRKLGKAGRVRWLGRRPRVRGVAMNKVDHPLGGGRGKSKSNKQPVSPAGLKAKGLRTRRPGPRGNQMVVKQRPKGKHVGK
ncbi:mitochondrial 54S ribosomal protein RML2 [Puccinia graminis f. sp. tritici CRL 75-36-700-3]|uniref:Large ribosomal subunit protein uL2m n=1 Tax=Puccinia graminis f. sp. tritici (strain CRL 75-36-700-3 / race SCCL) TaxID=418459 RepID=E3JQB7_PUCGT|nr:mitochondrial 54S ribosomal protein RML2 [Puccinia graminis f. sp. tritici CRL 75-36-700-3]EFP74481.1 hypothetical protein PGTG_00437 [Puccinia graminis f. sp. tritici CRL 75-36-700-3]